MAGPRGGDHHPGARHRRHRPGEKRPCCPAWSGSYRAHKRRKYHPSTVIELSAAAWAEPAWRDRRPCSVESEAQIVRPGGKGQRRRHPAGGAKPAPPLMSVYNDKVAPPRLIVIEIMSTDNVDKIEMRDVDSGGEPWNTELRTHQATQDLHHPAQR